jgi:hypothetical protein
MIRLCGAEKNLASIWALSEPYADSEVPTSQQVRDALWQCLDANQPDVPRPRGPIEFLSGGETRDELLRIFNTESRLDDTPYQLTSAEDDEVGAEKLRRVRAALEELEDLDPTTKSIFDLTMFAVFWAPCGTAAGGTTSQALGVLWADPRDSWERRDYLEFLVHELAHNLLFLSEWRYGLFTSPEAMTDRSNFALSAIRQTVRPLDKSLHSVIVGAEVLLAREEVLGHTEEVGLHPGSAELRRGVAESIDSIREVAARSEVLTPHAVELLDLSDEVVRPSVATKAAA